MLSASGIGAIRRRRFNVLDAIVSAHSRINRDANRTSGPVRHLPSLPVITRSRDPTTRESSLFGHEVTCLHRHRLLGISELLARPVQIMSATGSKQFLFPR